MKNPPPFPPRRRRSDRHGVLLFASLLSAASAQVIEPGGGGNPINARLENGAMKIDVDGNGVVEVAPSPAGPWVPLHEALPGVRLEAPVPIDVNRRFVRQRRVDGTVGVIKPVIDHLPDNPPKFSSIVARGFDGTRAGVEATLAPGQTVPELLPYFIGNEMVILRDDGLEGDTAARDGKFSGVLPVNLVDVERARSFMAAFNGTQLQDFVGRAVRPALLTTAQVVNRFDDFMAGKPVALPLPILLPPPGGPPVVLPPPPPGTTPITPCNQLPTWQKTLLITDLSVVEDPARTFDPSTGAGTPMGAWTFGKLMTDMVNPAVSGIDPADFARRWLRTWEADQSINNDPVPNRKAQMVATILKSWESMSGGPGSTLRMDRAPFRLLAIVNRLDLRGNVTYGGSVSTDCCEQRCITGEGRFVFCFSGDGVDQGGGYPGQTGGGPVDGGTDPRGGNTTAPQRPFLVIFEYCIPKEGCPALHAYAQEWANLQCLPWGPAYNTALQHITDQFASANAAPAKPNGSALNQLRTNENLLTPATAQPSTQWELREFKLFCNDSDKGYLRPVTVKQTPREDVDGTPLLQNYLMTTLPAPPSHLVPLEWGLPGFQKQPFLGGRAVMPPISIASGSAAWATTGASVNNMLRHDFALNTCNGCHSTETNTPFAHVGARAPGQQAPLSGFLTGDGTGNPFMVNIPGTPAATVGFFDLRRREKDLVQFLLTPCGFTVIQPVAVEAAAVH